MTTASEVYAKQLSATLPSLATTADISGAVHTADISDTADVSGAVQVIDQVPILWNWRPALAGMMDAAQFDFCDTIPRSGADGAPFFSSGDSFSDNYATFVSAITPPAAFRSLVDTAVRRMATPSPDAQFTPPGWARVAVNGVNEWKPVWSPQLSPDDWMADVVATDPEPRTVHFDLAPIASFPGASARDVSITAKAWGRIPITPGDWYSSSLVRLAAAGKQFPPWSASDLFGSQGLLRLRISELFVAYQPRFSMSVSGHTGDQVRSAARDAKRLIVGGMLFGPPAITNTSTGMTINGTAATADPQIVAVVITRTSS